MELGEGIKLNIKISKSDFSMKILFFNYEYPPLGGGAANATEYILKEFSRIPDLEVDLVTASVDHEYHLEKIGESIYVHRLPIGKNGKNLHFQSQKDLIVYAWKAYWFSRKLLKDKKFDLTHSFFTVPCGAVSWLLWLTKKIPYVVSLRGSDVPGYSDRFGFVYKSISFLFKEIWKKASAVVSNSKGLRELALKTNPHQEISIIYNGVDVEKFKPDERSTEHGKIYLTLGASRITTRKGIVYLVDAVKILSQKYPNIFMDVMGEGDARDGLEKYVKEAGLSEKIKFIGRIPKDETFSHYQKADIFVLPSMNEGMSNAMLEALATGLPIISTNTGGAEELVKDGINGLIVEKKNSHDLAEKIEKIISDENLRKRMGEESRKLAEKMSWENVAKDYFDLYEKTKR